MEYYSVVYTLDYIEHLSGREKIAVLGENRDFGLFLSQNDKKLNEKNTFSVHFDSIFPFSFPVNDIEYRQMLCLTFS